MADTSHTDKTHPRAFPLISVFCFAFQPQNNQNIQMKKLQQHRCVLADPFYPAITVLTLVGL